LKEALVRETARRQSNVNDVAAGILAHEFGVTYAPSGRRRKVLAGSSPVLLLRVPQKLKDEIHAEASRRGSNANDVILAALADGLGVPSVSNRKGRKLMASTNGSKNGRRAQDKVRVAIIGVGNCANSLLQGVEYYKDASPQDTVPGLMHVDLGGYHISDIEFTAAFDVVKGKVGLDLADAIWAKPNDTIKFSEVPKTGVKVSRGMTHDGLGKYISQVVEKAPGQTDDVVGILKETGTDVVVNYLPVGSEAATKWYTEQILEAGVAMVNCMPVFIAREPYWQKRFEDAGVPIIGDDIKSQVGATITHRVLTTLFGDRGVHLDRTMQLNVGGNSDFRNMLERERLESKKISKTNAVTSMLDYDIGDDNVHVGLRAVADGPQVGLHPHGGLVVRRRAAQRRAQARSLGLAELRRHSDRRSASREARSEQRHLGLARGAERVPHEVAAEADPRRRGARADRALHREERAREEAEGPGEGLTRRLGVRPDGSDPCNPRCTVVGDEADPAVRLVAERLRS
jgi:myo-inositol-1-phosphate synthase